MCVCVCLWEDTQKRSRGASCSISQNALHCSGSPGECDNSVSRSPLRLFSHGKTDQKFQAGILELTCDFCYIRTFISFLRRLYITQQSYNGDGMARSALVVAGRSLLEKQVGGNLIVLVFFIVG